ncbi:MAG: M20/M25/M40 family metallo-hydrolase [Paramuribaculum sp.]|nr:M20/M25/M40 family metallo-hydrolase [Paramuribaculum sp.]
MSAIDDALKLLSALVAAPSVSRNEDKTADILSEWFVAHGVEPQRIGNNIYVVAPDYDPEKPTLLMVSHHDTVKPSPAYTRPPYEPVIAEGRLYGLGSNDAGASVVAMTTAYLIHRSLSHGYNIILALVAEEEVGGENGIRLLLPHLLSQGLKIDMALVGEPTALQPAIGERGLVVLDCTAYGKTGHAARNEGVNALYIALDDISRLRSFRFPRKSDILGDIKMTVTQIEAGRQHNVIPEECRFVVDVRTTDAYSNEETAQIIDDALESDCRPRSTRVWASVIRSTHPLVLTAERMGGTPFVSPTTSDMSLLHNIPSLKIGPGESSRSHTADEFVEIDEIEAGINFYDKYLTTLDQILKEARHETME